MDAVQDDDIIIVHSGVYDEQLSISKPVVVIGAGTPQCYLIISRTLVNISYFSQVVSKLIFNLQ